MSEFFRVAFNKASDTLEIDVTGTIGQAYDWWTDETGTTKEMIAAKLKEVANSAASKIIVNINSLGGSVNHGISIHDALATHKAKVTTRVTGMTASAATIIAMAADPGQREISANALFLVHKAMNGIVGNVNAFKQGISDLEKVDETIANIYAKRTGKSVDEINAVMNRFDGNGEWLTPTEAKDLGFVDTIIEPNKAAAFADPSFINKIGLPQIPQNKLFTNPNTDPDMIKNKTEAENWFKNFIDKVFKTAPKAEGEPTPPADPPAEPPKETETTEPPATDPPAETEPVNIADMDEVKNTILDLAGQVEAKTTEVETLTAKVTTLEDQIAKMEAGKTTTEATDDPLLDSTNLKTNQAAAEKNANAFKS